MDTDTAPRTDDREYSAERARHPAGLIPLVGGLVIGVGMVLVVVAVLGDGPYTAQAIGYPGLFSVSGYALLRLVVAVAGGFTLGGLAYAVFCTPATAQGRIAVAGYRGVRVAELVSPVWLLAAAALVPVSAADSAGMSIGRVLADGVVPALIAAAEKPKAWIVVAVCVLVVAVVVRFVFSWNSVFGLFAIAAVGVISPAVVGNAGEGPDHDYASGAVILFTLALSVLAGVSWCVLGQVADRSAEHREVVLRRYRRVLTACVLVMVPTAAVLALILAPASVFGGWYGWLGVAAAALLAGHALLVPLLGRICIDSPALLRLLRGAVVAEVVWLAASVAMAIQPAPAFAHRSFTAQEVFLGFDLPDPPSVWTFATVWRFDIVLGTAAIGAAVAYVAGVVRLHWRGDRWPRWRSVSWLAGCVGLLLVTSSGISAYSYGMFSVHMAVHMALNMFLPELLVLGAPVTLLLRAVEPAGRGAAPGPREWVLWLMHSRFTRLLSHPGVALAVFVVSLYGLYFTPLFDQLIRFHWGHLLMNIHFLLTGYLFYWAIIGIDPGPRRLPHLGRLGMLFAVMPFHAFFGVAVMSMDTLIGPAFYPELGLARLGDLQHDQWLGGTLAWVSGEVPVLLVVGALLSQWSRQDRREAARGDRHQERYPDDDELVAYNAMLARLAGTRR